MSNLATLNPDAYEPRTDTEAATVQDLAMDWLHCKDVEREGDRAKKVRTLAGKLLASMLASGDRVTVNRGGFRTYEFKVTNVSGRKDGNRALAAMVRDGLVSQEQADQYLAASVGEGYEKIELKSVKV